MFMMIIPMLMLLILFLFILYKVAKVIGRTTAVFIDFILIGGFITYSLHSSVSVKIASGNAVYFWDVLFFIVSCVLYYSILMYLSTSLPRVAILINYIIAWLGTFFIYILLCVIFIGELPQLLNNIFLSTVTNLIIVSLVAIITYNIRKTMFIVEEDYV